jgi:hypothetical protein
METLQIERRPAEGGGRRTHEFRSRTYAIRLVLLERILGRVEETGSENAWCRDSQRGFRASDDRVHVRGHDTRNVYAVGTAETIVDVRWLRRVLRWYALV